MDLMLANIRGLFTPEYHLRMPYARPMAHCIQRGRVDRARQIAAENAAWWAKENEKAEISQTVVAERDFSVAMQFSREQSDRWFAVFCQGQLYARDTVRAFDMHGFFIYATSSLILEWAK